MRRSIRWSLLGWLALVLGLTLVLLGGTLVRQRRRAAEDAVRAELRAYGHTIAAAMEWDHEDGFELELDPTYVARFRSPEPDAPYFVVRGPDGGTLYDPAEGRDPAPAAMRTLPPPRIVVRTEGPRGTTVWVRRGTAVLERELSGFRRDVILTCLAGFVAAMLGGLLLVGRVLRPIRRISETASRISAANPDERIDVARMEMELASLATTLNQAFDRLREAVNRQIRFTADASHDLRTPLAVMQANVEWALKRERSPAEHREALAACLRATERMHRTVEGLLTLARHDASNRPPKRDAVDLAAVAAETVDFVALLAKSKGLALETAGGSSPAQGDAERLRECITALVTNALEHTPEGGRVVIRTGADDGLAWLEVDDTGPGIAEADLPHLFERFYRADATRRGGSGLGLAIAHRVAVAHGGRIEAANRPEGGARFRVSLPRRA